jgi:ATPase subunit of ABC transporter with duplicated ATPase domains
MRDRGMLQLCEHDVRGALAGNGEEMAAEKRKLKAKQSSSKKASKPTRKPMSRTGSKATKRTTSKARPKKTEELSSVEVASKDGAVILKAAANEEVAGNSQQIVQGLSKGAAKGNAACAKMLADFMVGKNLGEKAVKKRIGPTYAQEMTADEEWKGEREEGRGETGEGGVEPE